MNRLTDYLISEQFFVSLLIAVVAIILWLLLKKALEKFFAKRNLSRKQSNTTRSVLSVTRLIFLLLAVVMILQINGINVTSLVTGIGVIGIIVGFAIQDILKDFIMGARIMLDNFFSVGDVVQYGDAPECEVIGFNLKITKLYDVNTGDYLTVSNRNISDVRKVSDWLDILVPAPYTEPAARMRTICTEIANRATALEHVTACRFVGTDAFAESLINYRLRVFCDPTKKAPTRWAVLGLIQDVFAENDIAVPFNQLDVHLMHS